MWDHLATRDLVLLEKAFLRENFKITTVQTQDAVELPLI